MLFDGDTLSTPRILPFGGSNPYCGVPIAQQVREVLEGCADNCTLWFNGIEETDVTQDLILPDLKHFTRYGDRNVRQLRCVWRWFGLEVSVNCKNPSKEAFIAPDKRGFGLLVPQAQVVVKRHNQPVATTVRIPEIVFEIGLDNPTSQQSMRMLRDCFS